MRAQARPTSRAISAAIVAGVAIGYLLEARTYRFGNPANPGAGMFPVVLGVAMLLVAGGVLAAEWSGRPSAPVPGAALRPSGSVPKPTLRRVGPFLVVAALFPAAINIVGFEPAAALALPAMAAAMGERRPLRLLLLAGGGVLAAYLIFRAWLAVPLP